MRHAVLLPAALLLLAGRLCGAATLDGVNLGTFVSGPPVAAEDLRGHVVLFEYWGVHCPPCLASISHLAELQHRYSRDLFIIVANHCQREPADVVNSTWHGKGGGDDVSVVMDGDLPAANVTGIPRCFLFDANGALVYDGSPFDVEAPLAEAIKASPGALVVGHTFTKLTREAQAIGSLHENLAGVLRSVRRASAGQNAAAKDDADFLLGRLTAYTQHADARLDRLQTQDPYACAVELARLVGLFKGDAFGTPFLDRSKRLKADRSFQREVAGGGMLAEVRAAAAKIGLGADPDAKQRKQACEDISDGLQAIQKQYAGTHAAEQAQQLRDTWGL